MHMHARTHLEMTKLSAQRIDDIVGMSCDELSYASAVVAMRGDAGKRRRGSSGNLRSHDTSDLRRSGTCVSGEPHLRRGIAKHFE